ncbi:MAG: TonB-dependent receptor [bacterium]|nr:TonB-dependent receptor [bacterium]
MKKFKVLLTLTIAMLLISTFMYSQSKETGALNGTIVLEDGEAIPGVLVTLTPETVVGATLTTITNESGRYRFIGLVPGKYSVKAALEGFASAKNTGIRVSVGKTFTIDLTMKQGKITEEIVVPGKSALVDVKDSATASMEMTSEFLQNIPNTQDYTDLIGMAPGVSGSSAYGASTQTGVSWQLDGVDVSDPAGGSSWVFLDYNVIEEVSVSGIGAPAEYGNFSGVVFNSVTKSGGNIFKGYAEALYQGDTWNSQNSDDPAFESGGKKFYSIHFDVGGPIIKDKLSFFVSLLYYKDQAGVSGTDYNTTYKQPKGFLKLSWQPSKKTRIQSFIEIDTYDGEGRSGNSLTDWDATVKQESPEIVGNVTLLHLFSDYTFLEAKAAMFDGYFTLIPVNGTDLPGHSDYGTQRNTVNSSYNYKAARSRIQTNVSISHHADDFMGTHDFKFGAEFAHIKQGDQYYYNGGSFYYDQNGSPYERYDYEGYYKKSTLDTYAFFLQDSWSITDKLTINPGVRWDFANGTVNVYDGPAYKPKSNPAPRIGFTYDIFGDHTTAFKGHWGRYYEGAFVNTYDSVSSAAGEYSGYYHDGTDWNHWFTIPAGTSQYVLDTDIKQAYMDQLTFGIERELVKDISLSVTYIHRENKNIIAPVNIGASFQMVDYVNEYDNNTYQVYTKLSDKEDDVFLITNPKGGTYDIVSETPWKKYSAVEVLLNKRFSNKWQLMASYVYSKATGNYNNTWGAGFGSAGSSIFTNPNSAINAEGKLTNDPTHQLKISGSVILPFDIHFNGNFTLETGDTYTLRHALPRSIDEDKTPYKMEARGSNRYPTSKILDLRLEKTFKLGGAKKVGFILDIFNVFNQGIVTGYSTLSTSFETVTGISDPRAFRAGVRFWF